MSRGIITGENTSVEANPSSSGTQPSASDDTDAVMQNTVDNNNDANTNGAGDEDIDESLYSRQLYVMGRDAPEGDAVIIDSHRGRWWTRRRDRQKRNPSWR